MTVNAMRRSLGSLTGLIHLDLRHLYRRTTNPLLLVFLVLTLWAFALVHGTFHYYASAYAPFHGVSNPKYALGGYEPLLFYLCVIVALVFALRLPSYREDSIQNVAIAYRSPSNFQLALSRVLSSTLLVSVTVIVAALTYQAIAFLDVSFRPGIFEPFEMQSLVVVLTNLSLSMFFWTSLATLIAEVYKSATIGFLGTLAILFFQALISPMLPGELGSFTFGYIAASIYVTELAPDYLDLRYIAYFLSISSVAIALVLASSVFNTREDQAKKHIYKQLVVAFTSICVVCQASVHTLTLLALSNNQKWIQTYEETVQSMQQVADVTAINGHVSIEPGSRLNLSLNYTIEASHLEDQNASAAEDLSLWFGLNPGMKVIQAQCNGTSLTHTHINGILKIELDPCVPIREHTYSIGLVVRGIPNPHYLVAHTPKNGREDVDSQLVRLMGQRSSIFTSEYVALTPLSHWRPILLKPVSSTDSPTDPTLPHVSLAVEVEPSSWTVATYEGRVLQNDDEQSDHMLLEGKLRALGLLAADFRVDNRTYESIDVSILVHKRHAQRLDRNKVFVDGLSIGVRDAVARLHDHSIAYPQEQFVIVEVPTTLSLLNSDGEIGSNMNSTMFFRESGVPFARPILLEDALKQARESESPEEQVEFANSYYAYYWRNSLFNYTYEDAIVGTILSGRINEAKEQSSMAGMVLEMLLHNLLRNPIYRFDFDLANSLAPESQVNLPYLWSQRRGYSPRNLRYFQQEFFETNAYWELIEQSTPTSYAPESATTSTESKLLNRTRQFRGLKLFELLDDSFDDDALATLLTGVLNIEDSQAIDLDRIFEVAQVSNMEIASLVQNTLSNKHLPGIHFSVAIQTELSEPDEFGHQFNTVLDLRNSEDAVGYVTFLVGEFQEWNTVVLDRDSTESTHENRTFRVGTKTNTIGPFELEAKSSHRLVLNTETMVWPLDAKTYLSRNRGTVRVAVAYAHSTQALVALNDPGTNWYSFYPSQWSSKENENEIIVDDLDAGFEVPRSNFRKKLIHWPFETGLFRTPYPKEEGMDNGLPIEENPVGPWVRSSHLGCWGRYRYTYAVADTEKDGLHRVAFNAELPKPGSWKLSYHLPDYSYFLGFRQATLGNYDIEVTIADQVWQLTGDEDKWVPGWNEIGSFDIAEAGKARVSVSNKCEGPVVFADAIKWTYAD